MQKIKVYFNYKHTEKPWGGANNFNRLFSNRLEEDNNFDVVETISDNTNIIFLNGLSKGPLNNSKEITYSEYKEYKKNNAKIIIRAVNLKQHAHKRNIRLAWYDYWNIKILNEADFVIFQSEYQKDIFQKAGFNNKNIVIHNGANDRLFKFKDRNPNLNNLKLVSTSSGINKNKNLELLADISTSKDIEISHIGNWNETIQLKKVKLLGTKTHNEISDLYNNFDAFIFLGTKDMCPNVIFEAILSGLPVIYYPYQTSSSEIVNGNGISLNLDNYENTFNELRINYHSIVLLIQNTRDYYCINRTVKDYIKVFKDVIYEEN